MRTTGTTIVLISLLALSVCAPAASAEPHSMTFTEDRADVGADQLTDDAMFEAPDTAPFQARIDPGSGSITAGVNRLSRSGEYFFRLNRYLFLATKR